MTRVSGYSEIKRMVLNHPFLFLVFFLFLTTPSSSKDFLHLKQEILLTGSFSKVNSNIPSDEE